MTKRPTAVVSLALLITMGAAGTGAAATGAAPAAAPDDPTVVRLLGGGQLQVVSPDDDSRVHVKDDLAEPVFSVSDSAHPMAATPPCVLDAAGEDVLCPDNQVSSVLVQTGLGNDRVITRVRAVPVFILTGAGNDIAIDNFAPQAHFLMGSGNDEARPGAGADDILGGPDRDSIWYRNERDPMTVTLDDTQNDGAAPGSDNIHSDVEDILGGLGDDVLVGSDDTNIIDGRQGDDTIFGLGGDDMFAARGNGRGFPNGADAMFGGAGIDTAWYDDRTSGVAVRIDDLAFDGQPGENDNVHSDVENIIGTPSSDVLTGSSAGNRVSGIDGNDLLDGGLGPDVINGGAGTDSATYMSRAAGVTVRLDDVPNDGQAGEQDNVLDTENVTGGSGNDVLVGNGLRNLLSGGTGRDTLRGQGGDDLLAGGPGTDVTDGDTGSDTVTYIDHLAAVTASLDGVANDGQTGENDNILNAEDLIGGNGSDTLIGNAGRNLLRGLLGNDRLLGRAGDDTLIGSEGTDFADGGTGIDQCQTETTVRCP
jgi:Ca2+-binding RTX toxin-like protein